MTTETRLHNLALHVRNLLDCDQVSLCLCCPEPALHHPLPNLFSSLQMHAVPYYGSSLDLFSDEYIWALCDLALQSGCSIYCTELSSRQRTQPFRCIAVVVLERPAGILGFLLCASRQADAFQLGERRLLRQYLPTLACQVEQALSDGCVTMNSRNVQEQYTFISMVSHELRVPLTAIKGYAGLLQAYGVSDRTEEGQATAMNALRRQKYLDVIMEQTNHLEVLIGDVLDMSRIQSGRLSLHCTCVDLAQLCRSVTQLMQYRIDQQQPEAYHLLCSIDPELPIAWADPDRVQQVLTNLLENAIKYSPSGGLIEIRACIHSVDDTSIEQYEQKVPFVSITVRDHGIGIPHQQQSSLFKPFSRLLHPATCHVNGVGLGLYIARKLVHAMHGQLMLQSSEGKGTSVTFTLPMACLHERHPAYSLAKSTCG